MDKNIKPNDIEREWYIIDVKDRVLGRVATKIAKVLQGKNKPTFSPQWDMGDHVVVLNADKIVVTGNKEQDKQYYWHTGHPGGIKQRSVAEMRAQKPEEIITIAVRGMMPKTKLAKQMMAKLHVYVGVEHPYEAQKPKDLE